jgi:hypothetical protein
MLAGRGGYPFFFLFFFLLFFPLIYLGRYLPWSTHHQSWIFAPPPATAAQDGTGLPTEQAVRVNYRRSRPRRTGRT